MFFKGLTLGLRHRFDVIHAGRVLPEGWVAVLLGRLLRLPVVIYAHGEEITTWRRHPRRLRAMAFAYRAASRVVANSEFTRDRLLELGVPAYLIKATVRGIMSQRLVRILCPACKIFTDLDPAAWQELTQPWEVPPPPQVASPVGCKECRDTGYVGRQGIYEVLVNSPAVQAQITPQLDAPKIREVAMGEGMHTLRLSGAARVAQGQTTIEEVMRVAPQLDA